MKSLLRAEPLNSKSIISVMCWYILQQKMLDIFASPLYYCISVIIQRGDKVSWSFSNDKPIFQQIADIIILKIISGEYPPGYRLETVRDLALIAGVNPNTMRRALSFAEESGIIYVRRGEGRYVTEDTERIAALKKRICFKANAGIYRAAESLGA